MFDTLLFYWWTYFCKSVPWWTPWSGAGRRMSRWGWRWSRSRPRTGRSGSRPGPTIRPAVSTFAQVVHKTAQNQQILEIYWLYNNTFISESRNALLTEDDAKFDFRGVRNIGVQIGSGSNQNTSNRFRLPPKDPDPQPWVWLLINTGFLSILPTTFPVNAPSDG